MADLLFYEKVVSLDTTKHKNLRIVSQPSYHFAAKTNAVPLVGSEFAEAAKSYPIFFASNPAGEIMPLALLGLRDEENLFVTPEGRWDAVYIPAFVRRYPFAPANADQGDDMVICIDESAEILSEEEGDRILTDEGTAAPRLEDVLSLIRDYQTQYERTTDFVRRLEKYELLKKGTATVNLAGGESVSLPGMYIVDEQKLLSLPDEVALEFFRGGDFLAIYAHLFSIGNVTRLVERRAEAAKVTHTRVH